MVQLKFNSNKLWSPYCSVWFQELIKKGKNNWQLTEEDASFKSLSFRCRGKYGELDFQKRYSRPVLISKAKKKDLLDLLPLIPPTFHSFYSELKATNYIFNNGPDLEINFNDWLLIIWLYCEKIQAFQKITNYKVTIDNRSFFISFQTFLIISILSRLRKNKLTKKYIFL